jgi:phage protein D
MPDPRIPDFNIRINGANLPQPAQADIHAVTIQEDLEALSMFTLMLYNWDDEQLRVTWSDSSLFAVGNEVEISLGYIDDLHKVLVAEITSLELAFTADQPPMLTVRGYDHGHRLSRGRKTRTFFKMKDSAIAGRVASGVGLRAQATDSRIALEYVLQNNQTDLEFLQKRAQSIGYEVYVREKTLYFQPPQNTQQASIDLSLGEDIMEFTPRLSSLGQTGEVAVRGWDVKQKQAVAGKAAAGQENSLMGGTASGPRSANRAFGKASAASIDLPVRTKAEADQMALGQFNELALTYIQGDVVCGGYPQLHAGTVVNIAGAGKTFSGAYYVTSVTHTLSLQTGFQTNFAVRRNAA